MTEVLGFAISLPVMIYLEGANFAKFTDMIKTSYDLQYNLLASGMTFYLYNELATMTIKVRARARADARRLTIGKRCVRRARRGGHMCPSWRPSWRASRGPLSSSPRRPCSPCAVPVGTGGGMWQVTGAVTASVANTAKRVIVMVVSAVVFGEELTFEKKMGAGIAIGAVFLYSIIDDLVYSKKPKKA